MKHRIRGRKRRHLRVRKKLTGTGERPRLNIYRSNQHIYAQLIDDDSGRTLAAASSLSKNFSGAPGTGDNCAGAAEVGKAIAEVADAKGIKKVVFDRGGFPYHGRVKALADAAREAGLAF